MPLTSLITKNWKKPNSHTLKVYEEGGGYQQLRKALTMQAPQIIDELKKSNLRGRGGAGFPTGMKWGFVDLKNPKPHYLCVNADESEPGSFKDRYIMELDPHRMLEGIAIASWTLGVHTAYIYIRGEYKFPAQRVQAAVDEAYAAGYFGKKMAGSDFALDCYVVRGAGAYICGEESAMLESLEGKKGWPRLKPPFPAVAGLFSCPTIINNVETLASVPQVLEMGGEAWAKVGLPKSGGTRIMQLSGHIEKPGCYEVTMDTTFRELIYDIGGGIPKGRQLKCIIPGGSSCPLMLPQHLDCKVDFEAVKDVGTMAGTGGVIVMDDQTCMVREAWRVARFYAEESCGQCTPCREGNPWQTRILRKIEEGRGTADDMKVLESVINSIATAVPFVPFALGNTICALGEAAAMPTQSVLKWFRHEFEEHIKLGRCPNEKPWGALGEGRFQ
jgi:NADH-quinone oxidoreductase subunit F